MSKKLAVSAALSVLMMASYVLFGGESARAPWAPAAIEAPAEIAPPSFEVKALLR